MQTEFQFDSRLGRYRITAGKGKGQIVSRKRVLKLTEKAINVNKRELVGKAASLNEGKITLSQFQRESALILRRIHVQQGALGAGGFDQITPEIWTEINRNVKNQFFAGRDPQTNERYGLKLLVKDIKSGRVSQARLEQRLSMFAESGKLSYWSADAQVQLNAGFSHAIRILGVAEHCPECLLYSTYGPQPISSVIRPTVACRCRTNCKCSLKYLTIEDAIATSGGVGLIN